MWLNAVADLTAMVVKIFHGYWDILWNVLLMVCAVWCLVLTIEDMQPAFFLLACVALIVSGRNLAKSIRIVSSGDE